jgi:uroporphyrin-III C-methyltransferase/precorrin-2 dehydrogenase/sirohydrochlorin ferrochelatase
LLSVDDQQPADNNEQPGQPDKAPNQSLDYGNRSPMTSPDQTTHNGAHTGTEAYRFALFMNVCALPAVVVGGGTVAARKVQRLLDADAVIMVVAPELHKTLQENVAQGRIRHLAREFVADDLADARIVIAATSDPATNAQVAAIANQHGLLVNVADDPSAGNFIMPSLVDRSPLLIAISSGGTSPVLSRLLAARIEAFVPQTYRQMAVIAGRYRERVKARFDGWRERRRFWEKMLSGRVGELVLQGRTADAENALESAIASSDALAPPGEVYLVGAGPGDPDLLSVRALRLMQQANVVLYDRLVSDEVMSLVGADAERIYVGKQRSDHAMPQQTINEQLVAHARAGKQVLRLKGGDPFIFGRGGEEIQTLADAGVAFQVVPGVTAAAGCAAYAGIPLTHRDHAQACMFVTGQLQDGSIDLNWQALVQPQQTVVIYMGLLGLPIICKQLIAHGLSADKPAALVSQGTTRQQQVLTGTLESLPTLVADKPVKPPTLIIIGDVVRLREQLAWFETEQSG